MNKKECKQIIDNLPKLIPIKLEYGYGCSDYEFEQAISCVNELYQKLYDSQPYNFEDLKIGMWVYDIKPEYEEFAIFRINKILTEKECEYLYHDKNVKVFIDSVTGHAREFEEGRYFPITKAMEEFKNE